jgi:TrmH family RNA methyltransferase
MLTSIKNPLVKSIRKLHQGKYRRLQQQFLLEGTHLVQEALQTGYPLEVGCYTSLWAKRYPDLAEQLQQVAPRTELVADEVLQALTTTVHPDGVVAVAPQRRSPSPEINHLALVLETVQDPGNLGTVIRTGVAAGVEGLWLSQDSVAPDHPKVLRASAGQWFRLPVTVCDDLIQTVTHWHNKGLQIVATCADGAVDYWSIDFSPPTVVLLGNEGAGLSEALLHLATVKARIPMAPQVESLNVGIAAALLAYEAKRQGRAGGSAGESR